MSRMLTQLCALAAAAAVAAPVFGQAEPLRYDVPPGVRRVFERSTRTDVRVRSDQKTTRRVTEVSARREIVVVETGDDPPQMRVVTLETPSGERLVAYEENGHDRLADVPEAQRLRPMAPLLSAHRRDLTGRPLDPPPPPQQPMEAIDRAIAELRYLPPGPVGPNKPLTREMNLGVARLALTTAQVEADAAGETNAVVYQTTGRLTFGGEFADRITVTRLEARTAWAKDGSGLLSQRGTLVLDEKADEATQHLTRTWEERLTASGRLTPAALAKAKENLETLEKAMADARTGKLDAAVQSLQGYLEANPDGAWTPAVRSLHAALARRRLVAEPVKASRLRLMLRDLQTSRDRAGARGQRAALDQIDATLRQVVRVNAKQVLMDAADPDPIVRDLAAFALAFLDEPETTERLQSLARDPSAQVRGTALVSLAIRNEAVDRALLLKRLADEAPRVRGAAALLAERTYERGSEDAKAVLPHLLDVLESEMPWTRTNAASAVAKLAPKGSVRAVRALLAAHETESEDRLKQLYRAVMTDLTGVEADTAEPYRAWLKDQGGAKG
ncbi:MAG: HEAT repeat domain-containing protein [Phycisphaerae bacterium]